MATGVFTVIVPSGLSAGQTFTVQAPDGRLLNATVPEGIAAGQSMTVEAPPVVQAVIVAGSKFSDDGDVDDGGGDDETPTVDAVSGLTYFPQEMLQTITVTAVPVVPGQLPPNFNLTQLPREGAEAFVSAEKAPAPSNAVFEKFDSGFESGVLSFDEKLQSNPDELTRFFQTHNTKPRMVLNVHGYHKKRKTSGSGKNRRTRTVTVTDFRYAFELTELVSPFGYMQAKPTELGEPRSLPQVLQEYIASTNSLKEVNMHKHVTGFDTAHVCNVVTEHIRNQLGFQRRISVYVTYPDSCVKVVTPTNIAQCAQTTKNNNYVKCVCFLTCACIVWYPCLKLLGDQKDAIFSNFASTTNAATWLPANLHRLHCNKSNSSPLGGGGAWDKGRQVFAPPPSFPAMLPVVAIGWGAAANAPVVRVPMDTNGDGNIDAYGHDTTGDGKVDMVVPLQPVTIERT